MLKHVNIPDIFWLFLRYLCIESPIQLNMNIHIHTFIKRRRLHQSGNKIYIRLALASMFNYKIRQNLTTSNFFCWFRSIKFTQTIFTFLIYTVKITYNIIFNYSSEHSMVYTRVWLRLETVHVKLVGTKTVPTTFRINNKLAQFIDRIHLFIQEITLQKITQVSIVITTGNPVQRE